MCFYCHKLYYDPYAPLHSSTNCPHLIRQKAIEIEFMKAYREAIDKKD